MLLSTCAQKGLRLSFEQGTIIDNVLSVIRLPYPSHREADTAEKSSSCLYRFDFNRSCISLVDLGDTFCKPKKRAPKMYEVRLQMFVVITVSANG